MYMKESQLMSIRHPFQAPLVIQTVEVLLEQDLLQGPSSMGTLQATGQQVEENTGYTGSPWQDANWD